MPKAKLKFVEVDVQGSTVRLVDRPKGASDQEWLEAAARERMRQFRVLNDELASGALETEEWADAIDALLLESHSEAHWIGRVRGGGQVAEASEEDVYAGRAVKDGESRFLSGFVSDLGGDMYRGEDGELVPGAWDHRAQLYVKKVGGTAGNAWQGRLPANAEIYWRTGGTELHCEECPEIASGSPYTPATLFTQPRQGDTPCIGNCLCWLELRIVDDEGVETFTTAFLPFDLAA